MTHEQFCYWLQGYFEIKNPDSMTKQEIQIIKDHLQLVFEKVTPNRVEAALPVAPVRRCSPAVEQPAPLKGMLRMPKIRLKAPKRKTNSVVSDNKTYC